MTLDIRLDIGSISKAIRRLEDAKENIQHGEEQFIDIVTEEGADIAQESYGTMATAEAVPEGTTGKIVASGNAVVIAEFGAGDGTIPVMFENYVGVDVYPGSYSEQVGSGEYAATGRWHFGGRTYTEVPARAGMLNAREYIKDNAVKVAREVIKP